MLLRKRAWDVMREDFLQVDEDTSIADVISKLREAIKQQPDEDFVLVVKKSGQLSGAVTIRDIMHAIEDCVLRDDTLKSTEKTDWDKAFSRACAMCCNRRIVQLMERRPPVVRPNDPILLVLNALVESRFRWAAVEEGGKPIGVIVIGDLFREISREMVRSF